MAPAGWGAADAFGRAINAQRSEEQREEIVRNPRANWAAALFSHRLAGTAVGCGTGEGGGRPLETVSIPPSATAHG